jgi:hypothetical protein
MFSHIMIGSNDIARSKKFYDCSAASMLSWTGAAASDCSRTDPGSGSLLSNSRRPTPPVLEHDVAQRDAPDRAEPAHRVADRQQRIGVHVGRQGERCLRFLLVRSPARRSSKSR